MADKQVVQASSPKRAQPAAAAPAAPVAPARANMMVQLRQFGELHAAGVLTDEEFAAAKAKVLAGA